MATALFCEARNDSVHRLRQLPGPDSVTFWTKAQEEAYQPSSLHFTFLLPLFKKLFHILIVLALYKIAETGLSEWG